MGSPTVTVALPVYNGDQFLRDSIDSVLSQDYEDFELVLNDNASTDGTETICREYAARDQRVRYQRNDMNVGLAANFNRAFQQSRGRYFKWHAADDLLGQGYLRLCVDVLERDAGVVLVTPRTRLVEADGRTPLFFDDKLGRYPTSYASRPIAPLSGFVASDATVRFRTVLVAMRGEALNNYIYGLIRSELLRDVPLFQPFVGADKVLLARLSLHGKLLELPEDLFIWRHHGSEFGFQSHRDAARIWDPRSGGHLLSMSARQLLGYAEAVVHAPISPRQRLLCFAAIAAKVPHGALRRLQGLVRRQRPDPKPSRP